MRDRLIELRADALAQAAACSRAKNFVGAGMWRILAGVIEQLLAVGAC